MSKNPGREVKHAAHLMDESPMLVYPALAKLLGVNKSIIFQQLHFLLNSQKTSGNQYNYVDERWWVYNSYTQWQEQYFIWLSESTIKNLLVELEQSGIVLTMQSVKNPSDRRKWYTIDYAAWDEFILTMRQKMSDQPSDKNCLMVGQNLSDGYSDTSSETTDKNLSVAKNATGSDSILDTDSRENPNPPATKTNTQDPLQSSAKVSPAKPPREQDPIYNAVAEHIFGITDAETLKLMQEKESAATRIGIIVSWLNGKTDSIAYGKTKKFVGKINGTPTPEHVKTFAAWYAHKNSTAAMIRDGEKFVEYWRQWASTVKKTSTPRPSAPAQPAAQLTDEQRQRRQAELAARRNGAAHEHA